MIGRGQKVSQRAVSFPSGWLLSVLPVWLLSLFAAAGPLFSLLRAMLEQQSVGGVVAFSLMLLLPFWSSIGFAFASNVMTAVAAGLLGVLAMLVFKWLTGRHDLASGMPAGAAWAVLVAFSAVVSGGTGWFSPTVLLWRPEIAGPVSVLLINAVVGMARAGIVSFMLFGVFGNVIATLVFNKGSLMTTTEHNATDD